MALARPLFRGTAAGTDGRGDLRPMKAFPVQAAPINAQNPPFMHELEDHR
jgi:hypothetical protein